MLIILIFLVYSWRLYKYLNKLIIIKTMVNLTKNFGKRLQELRKAQNLTQAKLAELAQLEVQTISRIESGTRFPQKENIEKLAKVLNCEIKDLFEFKYNKNKSDLRADIDNKLDRAELKDLKYFNKIIDAYLETR